MQQHRQAGYVTWDGKRNAKKTAVAVRRWTKGAAKIYLASDGKFRIISRCAGGEPELALEELLEG